MLRRLQVSFERERRFRDDAAHELFSPLSGVQTEIGVALKHPRESVYYEQTLSAILGHTLRMSETLDSLLQLSRFESLEGPEREDVDLSVAVVERLIHFGTSASAAGIQLVHEVSVGAIISADPSHIELVIDNLVGNAIKYTPVDGHIRATVDKGVTEIVLTVTDTGIGFSESEQELLFDRFFRSANPAVQCETGSGLGLSITRALVEMSGGRVSGSSRGLNAGSTF